MAALFEREVARAPSGDFIPPGSRALVVANHIAARLVLSEPGEALMGLPAPRASIGLPWVLAARQGRLALGRATLIRVTRLTGGEWSHWEAQAHSERGERAGEILSDWYVWEFAESQVFPSPIIMPPVKSRKFVLQETWAQLATPEATQDSPALQALLLIHCS